MPKKIVLKKLKRGRPPMPNGAARTFVIRYRVTRAEIEAVAAKANAADKSISDYARDEILK